LGFQPARFDPDVWIKLRLDGSGYDYISTYVDDFLITAKDPWVYMRKLQEIYVIKDPKPPDSYLGATYNGHPNKTWSITASDYIKEDIRQIEKRLEITLREEKTPMKTDDHPEEDSSEILDNDMHREYQSLMGMLQWTVSLCRVDICYAVSSLSRFCACPRKGHLSRALHIWGYLKKYPNRCINIDPSPAKIPGQAIDCSLLSASDQYAYAHEELNPKFPAPMGEESTASIYFDSAHAHDKKTGRSISGVVVVLGNTPVIWKSKHQGAVQTSTYGAEFSPMRLATEETIAIRYMLRSLGIKTSDPSNILGDNAGVLLSATSNEVGSKDNIADLLTKPLERGSFMQHTGKLLGMNHGK
jgi:hypothetical protein